MFSKAYSESELCFCNIESNCPCCASLLEGYFNKFDIAEKHNILADEMKNINSQEEINNSEFREEIQYESEVNFLSNLLEAKEECVDSNQNHNFPNRELLKLIYRATMNPKMNMMLTKNLIYILKMKM